MTRNPDLVPYAAGRFYGVGLGPGDPELMTVKAHRLIASAEVVAYPKLPGTDSLARSIAAAAIAPGTEEIAIEVPMSGDRTPAQAAYDRAADRIAEVLSAGRDVVCLCEGDPFFYGSFMYLYARLAGRFAVEVVPGVTSVSAGAAAAGLPLVARNGRLTVLPGPLDDDLLAAGLAGAESVAILKVGRHLAKLREMIATRGLTAQAVYVERAGLPGERICPLAEAPGTAPYFSMILIRKEADPWLKT